MTKPVCPRCGGKIVGFPAISRVDNETAICSTCGEREGFATFLLAGYGLDRVQVIAALLTGYLHPEGLAQEAIDRMMNAAVKSEHLLKERQEEAEGGD